jgi:hypothetical protein
VIGSIARSLLVTGLQWLWIAKDSAARRPALLGELRDERNRVLTLLATADASCGNLNRWLMPLPAVADLTGESLSWLEAPAMPAEEVLLDDLLASTHEVPYDGSTNQFTGLQRLYALLDMAGLRGATMVLAHASHGNHLGLLSSLTEDGAAGHDLRADHEALFMHVAAAGVTIALAGAAAAVPELWPAEIPQHDFLDQAIAMTREVSTAAVAIHKLTASRRTGTRRNVRAPRDRSVLRPGVVIARNDLLPDVNSTIDVARAAEKYYVVVRSQRFNPWHYGQPALHLMLMYGGGNSNLETVMATYDQRGSAVISVYAARMLLEEAARATWRYSIGDIDEFTVRAKQYFDEYRVRRKRTIDLLSSSGVPNRIAEDIFSLPNNVIPVTPVDEIASGRQRLPSIASLLRELGADFPEPDWLEVAYSLLSQVTHATAVGHLHAVRVRGGEWQGGELSIEMIGLALDVACFASAQLIGLSARLLTGSLPAAVEYHAALLREAGAVHRMARMVHGLD